MACVDAVLGGPGATCVSSYIYAWVGVLSLMGVVAKSLANRWQIDALYMLRVHSGLRVTVFCGYRG